MSLFANIFGDFGAAGMPGTFKRFLGPRVGPGGAAAAMPGRRC